MASFPSFGKANETFSASQDLLLVQVRLKFHQIQIKQGFDISQRRQNKHKDAREGMVAAQRNFPVVLAKVVVFFCVIVFFSLF